MVITSKYRRAIFNEGVNEQVIWAYIEKQGKEDSAQAELELA